MKRILIFLSINLFFLFGFGQDLPWPAESPNPDDFGYTFKTNSADGGPDYNWVEISNAGTVVEGLGDDNFVGPFQLGIDFRFYWLPKTEVYISSNGHISFEPFVISSNTNGFPPFPGGNDGKNDIIAPYLADLTLGQKVTAPQNNPGQVLYYSDQANNRFIVTYKNVPYWVDNANDWQGINTFQVILDGNDNSITFQYRSMFGDWSPSYNSSAYPFTVGIEALTGNIGISTTDTARVTTDDKPVNETAVKFFYPANPSPIIDMDISELGPSGRKAFFVPWSEFPLDVEPRLRLNGKLRNLGSGEINSAIIIEAQVKDSVELIYFSETDTIFGGLQPNQVKEFTFSNEFYPPWENSYSYSVRILNGGDVGDVNPGNDETTVEVIAIDTTLDRITLSYTGRDIAANVTIPTDPSGVNGSGVGFEPPAYPAVIQELQFFLALDPDATMGLEPGEDVGIAVVYGPGQNGEVPGPLIYSDTINQVDFEAIDAFEGIYFRVPLPSPETITEGEFYVGWLSLQDRVGPVWGGLPPVSGRSFEILGNIWAPNRNAFTQEYWMRAIIGLDRNAVYTPIDREIEGLQNFNIYPNPNQGRFRLEIGLSTPAELGVKIFDMKGNKVYLEHLSAASVFEKDIDLSHVSPGLYTVQILTSSGQQSKRILVH